MAVIYDTRGRWRDCLGDAPPAGVPAEWRYRRVEQLIDVPGGGLDDLDVILAGLCDQAALNIVAIDRRYTGRQHVDGAADHPQMILTDPPSLHRCRHMGATRGATEADANDHAAHGMVAASDVPTPAGLLTDR